MTAPSESERVALPGGAFSRRTLLRALAPLGIGMLAAACSPAGETGSGRDSAGRPVVYASFYPIHDLVDRIAGEVLDVRCFLPPGQDPHLWEPSPQAMRDLARADLLVVNGANMEPWLPQVRENLPGLPVLVLSDYVELITYRGAAALGEFQYLAEAPLRPGGTYRLSFGHTHERYLRAAFFTAPADADRDELVARGRAVMGDEGEDVPQEAEVAIRDGKVLKIDMGHETGRIDLRVPTGERRWFLAADRASQEILSYDLLDRDGRVVGTDPVIEGSSSGTDTVTFDPHSWLSVVNAKRYCNAIRGELAGRWPEHAPAFKKAKFTLVRTLTRLQAEYKEIFAGASRRDFIVSHNAFAYLARDFGLEQRSLQGLTTNEAPSLFSLVSAIRYVRDSGVRVVYHELGTEDPGIRTIVDEVGGRMLPLASMELVAPGDDRFEDGYLGYLEMNLENLAESIA